MLESIAPHGSSVRAGHKQKPIVGSKWRRRWTLIAVGPTGSTAAPRLLHVQKEKDPLRLSTTKVHPLRFSKEGLLLPANFHSCGMLSRPCQLSRAASKGAGNHNQQAPFSEQYRAASKHVNDQDEEMSGGDNAAEEDGDSGVPVHSENPMPIPHKDSSTFLPDADVRLPTQLRIRFPGEFCNTGTYLSVSQSSDMLDSGEDLSGLRSYLKSTTFNSLPLQHVARLLLDSYFQAIHPIWPLVDEGFVRCQFNETWTSDQPPHPLWIAQLNLILALGCQAYEAKPGEEPPLSDIYHAGEDFYQRAQMFVAVKAFNFSSVGLVQALLLMHCISRASFERILVGLQLAMLPAWPGD
ncbi:hypothetical protein BP6252_02987 [Coleophoma cylindrospora]|uniref:Xylanolytic transcriptional activator regulatory domain-containing protein n=1 Tax=Coleophoma cylindrospora TaxID=1849047 RepID=A0A3D8S6D6_9HELO|nr:hypothetical protein BP6252_02987 [Coleophoma cylindrospora]